MKYKIYPDRNLLVDILENDIVVSDLENIFLNEIKDENFKYVKKVLSNILDANLNISADEMQSFINLMITPNPDISFRWAILSNKPVQTAFSFLIKHDIYFNSIVGVFSTLEGCNSFLNVTFDLEEFKEDGYLILN